jgi:pimeloyl-ACP methyl ester carboxylesterase
VLIDPARVRFETREDADEFYGGVRSALGPFPSREAALEQARRREPRARWTPERERAICAGYRFKQDGSVVGKMPNWVVDRLRGAREGHDDVGPLLGGIGVPVLLLVSSLSNERRQQQKLEYSRRIPRVQVEMLEGTHALQLDLPERVSELIVQFLEA